MQTNFYPDGSLRDLDRSSGALYRVGADCSVRRLTPHEFDISNTLARDEARGMLVFGYTLSQPLFRIDWPIGEDMSRIEEWAIPREHGFSDGSCIDEDSFVRNAGGRLIRHSPDSGIDRHMEPPATNITACGNGDPDRPVPMVTTATNQLNDEELKNPNDGALLAPDAGVRGPNGYRFYVQA